MAPNNNRAMNRPTSIRIGLILLCLALLSGCASRAPVVADGGLGERVAQTALGRLGKPYRYGAAGPNAFDCSGLVHYAYRQHGLAVPRTTGAQRQAARRVGVASLRPGDLLFFEIEGKLAHVGLYTGDQRFVHAPSGGKRVSVSQLDHPYWRERLVGAGRLH